MNLIHILKCFELASGLKVNIDKSRLIRVGVSANEVIYMASSLGYSHDTIPFSYLGLSVGKRMNSCSGWNVVTNRFREKLTSWKSNSLSIGGRLTLSKNIGLLCKWKWRFLVKKSALWQIVIKEFNGKDGGFDSTSSSLGVSNGQNTRANDNLSAMLNLIGNLVLNSGGPDKWEWACDKSGMFKTKTLYQSEVSKILDEDVFPAIQRISKGWISAWFKAHDARELNYWIQRPWDILSCI
ncbi:hypothetical protein Tco_0893467 [Tanacetum coccineum]|uniref:RNA-directed DNA polymerase, eukaryota, reverse transcriptase zinc-binding domain protein n=1 Tax=Tanacetum coccineum TaxID=301880 RepID=A0ABQ5C8X2_9ASTR